MNRSEPSLFARLLDDAALFPPARMDLASALSAHLGHKDSWYGGLTGPFVCSDNRLEELGALAEDLGADRRLETSVVVTGGPSALAKLADRAALPKRSSYRGVEVDVVAYEVALGPPEGAPAAAGEVAAVLRDAPRAEQGVVPVFVEVPWQDAAALEHSLDVLAGCGARAKLRTGGLTEAAFPKEADVARFITAAVSRDLVFKCTAGLHEAVRVRGRTGFEQMGFLNLLLATAAALEGAEAALVAQVLAERDEERVVKEVMTTSPAVRRSFASIGTCSVPEPVEELVRLGLLQGLE